MICPVSADSYRPAGVGFAITRTRRLLDFLVSEDEALRQIDWAVSPVPVKNLYIIDKISSLEGFEKEAQRGYEVTIRQTAREAIQASLDVCERWFRDLQANTLVNWPPQNSGGLGARDKHRLGTVECLSASLRFLEDRGRGWPDF